MRNHLRILLIACFLSLVVAAWSFADVHARVGPMLRSLAGMNATERSAAVSTLGVRSHRDGDEMSVIIDYSGDPQVLRAAGARIRTQIGTILTADIPAESVDAIASLPGLKYIQAARFFTPTMDVSVPDTHASNVRSGAPPDWSGYTGKGVVIGSVDTGIDVNHQDFKRIDGTSRILYVWDQTTGTGGANHPSGYTYGTEWTKAQIDAGQCTERDTGGHGTSVMSIAAGNGSATGNGWPAYRYVGMAPEADIITVKSTLSDGAIIDGMNYIKSKAAALGKPCVINLSIGSQMGAHDGTDSIERAIDQIAGQGVVVCTSTGNNGTTDPTRYLHAGWAVAARNSQVTAGINVLSGRANPFYIDVWYQGDDLVDITLKSPNGYSVNKSTGQTTGGYTSTPDGGIWIENSPSGTDPYNGGHECVVSVQNGATGSWSLTATARTVRADGACDAWIETNQNVFWSSYGTNSESLTIPGTAAGVITTGGYVTKTRWTNPDGTLQGWSSTLGAFYTASGEGPTRDGRPKPDICVPSTRIASSLSADYAAGSTNIVEDGVHLVQTGTSMAVPHISGAAALLLQRDPTATAAEVKSFIASTARADSLTGAVPNMQWGHGKLDVQAAMNLVPMYTDISAARVQPDGTPVKLPSQIVTAGLSQFTDRFYIESADRSAGIQVRIGAGSGIQANEGSKVTIKGTIGLADGERAVLSPTVTPDGTGTVPRPLALLNRSAGGEMLGDSVPGVSYGSGLNNIGLLVAIWGRVTYVGDSCFYVNDGTGLIYPPSSTGVKVSCVGLTKPAIGAYALATGISTLEWDGSTANPVIRVRKQSDLKYY